MRKWMALAVAAVLLCCVLTPSASFTEDRDTILLARAIYALAKADSYEAKLALGTVVLNRVDSVWYPDSLSGVLNQQHQFPIGSRYDSDSLSAAHAVLSGRRTLSPAALNYRSASASVPRDDTPLATVGGFHFYG